MGNSYQKFATFLEKKFALDNLTTREYNNRTKYSNSRPMKLLFLFFFKF